MLKSAASFVSVNSLVADVTEATSFAPVILIVTLPLAVPSLLVTVNSSFTACPAVNSLCASLATYVQLPFVSTVNLP